MLELWEGNGHDNYWGEETNKVHQTILLMDGMIRSTEMTDQKENDKEASRDQVPAFYWRLN